MIIDGLVGSLHGATDVDQLNVKSGITQHSTSDNFTVEKVSSAECKSVVFQANLRVDNYDSFVGSDRDQTPFNLVDQDTEDLRGTRYNYI